jgi:cytosine/adenosine deaminase-related metal-dependent hydrolase
MGFIRRALRRGPKPDKDTRAIDALLRRRADLSHPVALRHFLYFAREYEALVVAAALRTEGFDTRVSELPMNGGHLVLAHRDEPLDAAAIHELRDHMDAAAHAQKGEYDGWEAVLDTGVPVVAARR